jgi:hypothetical protein
MRVPARHAERRVTDREMAGVAERFPVGTPVTKESYFYRSIFEEPVGEGASGIMARAASNAPIGREATIEEQSLTERNLLGCLRIVGRYRRVSRVRRDPDLMKGLGPGERTRFGNGRRLGRGLPGRSENQRRGNYHECEADFHARGRVAQSAGAFCIRSIRSHFAVRDIGMSPFA